MHFELKGKEDAPLIVLYGMPFCSMEPLIPLAERLERDCRVLLVTWDGHEQREITYTNARDQAAQTVTWLRNSNIRRIDLLCGMGGGGKAAMELAHMLSSDPGWHIGRVLFDGCALGHMLWPRRMLRLGVVKLLQRKARKGTPEEAVTRLLGSRLVRCFTGEPTPYRPFLTDFVRVSRNISAKSTRSLVHDACRCTLHEFPEKMTRRLMFMWSRKEPARLARARVLRHYPLATEHLPPEPGVQGFLVHDPAQYAQMLSSLAHLPVGGKSF